MRHSIVIACLVGLAACSPAKGTGPDAALIRVLVRDDAGLAAGRNPIVVTRESVTRANAQTRSDGTVEIGIGEAGEYTVQVIPRAGYFAGVDPLTKRVTVTSGGRAEVTFTLYRSGVGQGEPPPESPPWP